LIVWENDSDIDMLRDLKHRYLDLTFTNERREKMEVDTEGWPSGWWKERTFLSGYVVRNFLRRGAKIRVQVRDRVGPTAPSSDFVFANPTLGPYPVWQPERSPPTQQKDGLKVTVDRFQAGVLRLGDTPTENSPKLELRVREHGKPAAAMWKLERASV
jgi:hypothetical protein